MQAGDVGSGGQVLRSEDGLRVLYERIGLGLVQIDAKGRIVSANPAAQSILGRRAEDLVGLSVGAPEFAGISEDGSPIPVESRPCIVAASTGKEVRGSVMGLFSAHRGELRWIRVDAIPVLDPASSAVVGVWGVFEDITAGKYAESELRRSAAEKRTLIENVPGAVFRCEVAPPWRMSFISAGVTQLAGYLPDEFMSGRRAWADIMVPEDIAPIAHTVQEAVAAHKPYDIQYRITHADGSQRWVQERGQAAYSASGEPMWIDGVVIDITARKEAERALRESEAWLSESQRASRIGSYVFDANSGAWKSSKTLDEIFGIGPDYPKDVGGWLALVHPEDRDQMAGYLKDEVLGQGKPFDREYRIVRRSDGQTRWVLGRGSLSFDPSGAPVSMMGTIQDVTERRLMEEQLATAQRMEAVGRLAGGIAHDFNNILTVINGYADLLLNRLAPDDPMRVNMAEIRAAGERAAALTRQLLAFSRRQMTSPERLNLNAVIQDAQMFLERLAGEHVRLVTQLDPSLGDVQADPSHVHQILLNLTTNARDAMPNGGLLTIETANVEVDEHQAAATAEGRAGSFVRLSVTDTGTGMDAETQRHLFEPFFTTKPHGRGTGLGLPTVYGIVRQSGGWITFRSAPGEGASFHVYLPRLEPSPAAVAESPQPSPSVVLVVDDQPDVRHFAATVLRTGGYQVLEAASAEQALAVAAEHRGVIDVALTDIVMPGMSGRDLAPLLRARRPSLRIIFMSGHTEDPRVKRSAREHPASFLAKPFRPGDLLAAVRKALSNPVQEAF